MVLLIPMRSWIPRPFDQPTSLSKSVPLWLLADGSIWKGSPSVIAIFSESEALSKWPPFCRQYFQIHFLEWRALFSLKVHWNVFPRAKLILIHHCFRWWRSHVIQPLSWHWGPKPRSHLHFLIYWVMCIVCVYFLTPSHSVIDEKFSE